MADLSVLIRLHKHELDEKRRALAGLYGEMAMLDQERDRLEREFAAEKAAAAERLDEIHYTFPHYVETVRRRREALDRAKLALEKKVEAAKDSLMDTFSELKKYEMTQEERERLEREEQLVKENATFDQIALEGFMRNKKDD